MSRSRVLKLARRHELLHSSPKMLLAAMAGATFAVNVLTFRIVGSGQQVVTDVWATFLLEAVLLAGFAATLFKSEAGRRCRAWEAALPLPSYSLWRSHFLALVLSGLVAVGATAVVMVGFILLLRGGIDRPLLADSQLVLMGVRPLLLMVAASGLVALRRLDLTDLADDRGWPVARGALVAGMYAALLVFHLLPPAYAILPVVAVSALLLRARSRLPQVLEAWPSGAEASAGRVAAGTDPQELPVSASGSVTRRVVMRQLFKWPMNWILMPPFLLGGGLLLAGFLPNHTEAGFDDPSMRLMNFWIIVYMLLAVIGHFVENLWRVDHLPVGRRRLLLWAVLPNVVALLVGYAIGIGILERQKSVHDEIELLQNKDHLWLDVPLEYFDLSWNEQPPAVATPDGSMVEAYSQPILPGTPLSVHNTYHLPPGSGAEFVAWQIARAVEQVYGVAIPAREIEARYLKTDADGYVAPVEGGLTLRADYPELEPSYRGPVFPLLIGSLLTAFLLILAGLFATIRPGTTIRRWRIWFWGSMIVLLAAHITGFGVLIARWTTEWAMSAVVLVLARRLAEAGPVAMGLTWVAAAAVVAGAWRLAEGRFRAAEAPRSN